MTSRVGRKRVKMKPPWRWPLASSSRVACNPTNCLRLKTIRRRQSVICVASGALVALTIVAAIICDQRQLAVSCLRVDDEPHDGGGSGEQHLNDQLTPKTQISTGGDPSLEVEQQQQTPSSPSSTAPHFNLARMPPVVAASSYQSEVYLPCQIVNLDEDQTVSFHGLDRPKSTSVFGSSKNRRKPPDRLFASRLRLLSANLAGGSL